MPSVRPLTLATFGPALLTVVALPFGFIDEGIAVVAGVYGLYFAIPATVAWCLDLFRSRLPRWAQRTLGVLIFLVAVPAIAFWLLWTGPLFVFALPPTAVILIVASRLVRAAPSAGGDGGDSGQGALCAPCSGSAAGDRPRGHKHHGPKADPR